MEASSGNGSKGGWVLLLDRRDQKNAYSFVTRKEFADWSVRDLSLLGGAHIEMQHPERYKGTQIEQGGLQGKTWTQQDTLYCVE